MVVLNGLKDPQLLNLLSKSAVGIMPTDTIYGIVAPADKKDAVQRLHRLKRRQDAQKSGTVIVANTDQLIGLGIDREVIDQVAHLWPNPLSIEVPLRSALEYLFQSGPHRAFRVVTDPEVRALLEETGPLLTSSVNPHGAPPATTLEEARAYFGDEVDFYVDGGDRSGRPPSTVASLQNGKLTVLRAGAVRIDENGKIA